MARWDNILETWASAYRPLSHVSGGAAKEKAFYRVDSLNAENEFVRNVNTAKSPAMAYSTLVDAQVEPGEKIISYAHTIYFMTKQKSVGLKSTFKNDDDAACECKEDLNEICIDFCAFLAALRLAANSGQKELILCDQEDIESMSDKLEDNGKSRVVIPITSDVVNTFRGIEMQSIAWGSLPVFKNGWWVFAFQFEVKEPRQLCLNKEKYK